MGMFLPCVPGFLLLFLCSVPLGRTWLRSLFEPWLERTVSKQLAIVLKAQEYRCAALDALARASAATVSIEGYLICLPLLFLAGYEDEACLLASALALATHVTCALKDLFCGPRPGHACQRAVLDQSAQKDSRPAVQAMEADRDVEFGCPSMHVALVLVMNGYAVHLLLQHSAAGSGLCPAGLMWPWLHLLLGGGALMWVALVTWSRLYLGVHSPVDLAMGGGVGLSLLILWIAVGQNWLASIKTEPWAFGAHFFGCMWLLLSYPEPPIHTTSYTFTTVFCGAELGVAGPLSAAFWASPLPTVIKQSVLAAPPQLVAAMARMAAGDNTAWLCYRLLGGVTVVLVVRSVSKALLVPTMPALLRCFPACLRSVLQPPVSVDYVSIGERLRRRDALMAAAGAATAAVTPAAAAKQGEPTGGDISGRINPEHSERPATGIEDLAPPCFGASPCASAKAGSNSGEAILLRPDGYPWDADVARRVGSYFCAVASLVVYVRSLQAAAEVVASW